MPDNSIKEKIATTLQDIRFWIILFFLVRLIGITAPPLEVAHNWRQTMGTMVARNFLETDNNILYPRIDVAGEKTGITGMEFPALNYFVYICSLLFGYEHWYGRLINLVITSFGLFFFYKLILRYFERNVAFFSTLVLLFSIWFIYSRKIMPDTSSMSLMIAGVNYGARYLEGRTGRHGFYDLMLCSILIASGILLKLSSAYILAVFPLFLINRTILLDRKIIFTISTIFSISVPILWYFYWVPYLHEEYGYTFFMGKNLVQGIQEIIENAGLTLKRFYDTPLKYAGFTLFLFGLFRAIRESQKLLLAVLFLTFSAFLLFVFKAGFHFAHHTYYVIPFVPVMALVCGYGIDQVKNRKLGLLLLVVIGLEGILNQQDDFRIHEKNMALVNLEADLDRVSERKDRILINCGEDPAPMYFAHRKGWVDYNEKIMNNNFIRSLQEKGLKHIVILKRSFGSSIDLDYEIVSDNPDYCIYKL